MCMALAALFSIVMAAGIAYKMMVKHEPLDVMKLFRPLAVSIIICWWYPPADTGMAGSRNNWCFLDFLSYIPNCIGSYTHDLYEAEASQISDRFEEVQQLIHVRDTMYTNLQAQADVAHTGTSDPNLIEATMEQTGVDEVTSMEKDAAKLWFTSLTAGVIVGIDKIIMLIALVVFRIGWWATIYCQQIGSVEISWGLFFILVKYCLLRIMKNDYLNMLASLVLPAQILDYFLISGVEQTSQEIHISLDEKMNPKLSNDEHFESKGFMEAVNVTDFPIRDHKVILKIRRRRWTDLRTGKSFSIPIDLDVVAKGTRYSKEFGAFLKETYGDIPSDLPYA